jgi:2-dehydro-3-deoxy-D-gluconate 5-dehydrogenase
MSRWLADQFGLAGRTALVTGARTGIGREVALSLARAGADLVLCGRSAVGLDDVAAEVARLGVKVTTRGLDMADPAAVAEAAGRLAAEVQVDILVNNAGTTRRGPVTQLSTEDWRAVLSVNLDSVFELTKPLAAAMVERGSGKIVNVASLLSFQGGLNVAAYAASKHALVGLTQAMCNEWSSRNVNVNAVAPGYVETAITVPLRADARRYPEITARIPAGRWARPGDIAGAVVFLCSRAASYVHGHVLVVDGGWMAR